MVLDTPVLTEEMHLTRTLTLDNSGDLLSVLRASVAKDTSIRETAKLITKYVRNNCPTSVAGLVSAFFKWEGKPYSLDKHYQFEPVLHSAISPSMVWMTGRQLGKTVAESVEAVLRCATLCDPRPYSHMFVTPLFEQVRRISNDHIRPLTEDSPLRTAWMGRNKESSVLRRIFKNGAKMIFTYANTSADRIRGNSVDGVTFDEVQDFREEFFPVINEAISASPYKLLRYYGTAKGSDTTLARLWHKSSKAEWVVPCRRCGYKNIPSLQYDLLNMIGPIRDDISEDNPGTICANRNCRRVVHPRLGRWVHKHPSKSVDFPGFHLPQPIMETHYGSVKNWTVLHRKMNGGMGYTTAKFNNEVLGEPVGAGVELISEDELARACVLDITNKPDDPPYERARDGRYRETCQSADWGGGGEDFSSRTVSACGGMTFDGKIDIFWGKMLPNPHDHMGEAAECADKFWKFRPANFAHDFTGAGTLRESLLTSTGIDVKRLRPYEYVRSSKQKIVRLIPPTKGFPRRFWRMDKARAILMTIAGIKLGLVRFFRNDYKSDDDPGLIRHFLALTERKNEAPDFHLHPVYSIGRHPGRMDDFAQAVTMICATLWDRFNAWPNDNMAEKYRLSKELEKTMVGTFDESDMDAPEVEE